MTGNDIIDKAEAAIESNWKRKGFIEKIFTPREQQYIHTAVAQEEMVWQLWSMKESAYKIHNRQYGKRFFAPLQFSCTLLTMSEGMVDHHDHSYPTITNITEKFIYSIATPAATGRNNILNCCFHLPLQIQYTPQHFIDEKIISRYASVTGISKKDLKVSRDNNGIPDLHCRTTKTEIPLSITHHGNYAAFTICQY